MTISCCRSKSTSTTPSSFGFHYVAHSGCNVVARGPPPLVVATLRGALLSVASPPVDFSLLHRYGAATVLSLWTTASSLSSSPVH
uniref:Uncharacterized protein n=1 Tax=Oryza punctata TaxID=4537 RepID=A0A0E0M5T6_ORYPU